MKYIYCVPILFLFACSTVQTPETKEPQENNRDDTCIEGCGHMYSIVYDYGGKFEPICLCSTRPLMADTIITASSHRQ